jgi:penicillin-binding protein 1B
MRVMSGKLRRLLSRLRRRKYSLNKRRRRRSPKRRKSSGNRRWLWLWLTLATAVFSFAIYVVYLDFSVRAQFEGSRWALPARVYARALELYPDQHLNADQFAEELHLLGYRPVSRPSDPGTYTRIDASFIIKTRDFVFWDGAETSRSVRLEFSENRLMGIWRADVGDPIDLLRLDPPQIGSIYPSHNEDRVLVQIDDVPALLIDTLIAVEDRGFYEHHGVSPRSILRAMMANLRAGHTVQGGSTLTQQLVKNLFLTNERTLTRKINEAIMALLVDWHYEKDEILEAYLNEVYLGQDGRRSIHGFGLASQFYFERPLSKLMPSQIALLVALVKGPSYYDPRRNLLRAHQRRDLVLELLFEQQKIPVEILKTAQAESLGVLPRRTSGVTRVPAFIDLVRRQLRRDYTEEDLSTEGLNIFTTLDPEIQNQTELAITRKLNQLARAGVSKELQGAAVVVNVSNGEVQAVVGGRDPRFAGFNRALDAVRPVGSLIKPAVYLTALLRPEQYTLASLIDDGPLDVDLGGGEHWTPQNYDHENHGNVLLHDALAMSYNVSTARLGLEIGVPAVLDTLRALGVERPLTEYPALLLGAANLSPINVAQMYQTIASGGFRTPLRAIRAVLTSNGKPLQRYPLSVEPAFDGVPVFQLTAALRAAAREGTGKNMYQQLPKELIVAGKTGTTDDLRDSWFVGFGENILAAVWLGLDDNKPAGLTGAGGALKVWSELMSNIEVHSLSVAPLPGMESAWIDRRTGLLAEEECASGVDLVFVKGTKPQQESYCE